MTNKNLSKLNIEGPILAPLAGVSDIPFRRICSELGAGLTYIEMLSATAICYKNEKTFEMMATHPEEPKVGVQITSRCAEEMGRASAAVQERGFHSIDINMGCPVKKVVKVGCGSAILKDPERVYQTTLESVKNSDIPVSVKIRLGWDHSQINWDQVAEAAVKAGASWLTIHGRTRSDSYAEPVLLNEIAHAAKTIPVPIIGNGNLFTLSDAQTMKEVTQVAGIMVSRGALGNPWVFRDIQQNKQLAVTVEDWQHTVTRHISYQEEYFRQKNLEKIGTVCMRKHMIWYLSGWPEAKPYKQQVSSCESFDHFRQIVDDCSNHMLKIGVTSRTPASSQLTPQTQLPSNTWDPKFEMDRKLDRGVSQIGY